MSDGNPRGSGSPVSTRRYPRSGSVALGGGCGPHPASSGIIDQPILPTTASSIIVQATVIFVICLGFNFFRDARRYALDPRAWSKR
jgi:ABC-type dipeptide/oligopeptide/nickel transport system permease subunit